MGKEPSDLTDAMGTVSGKMDQPQDCGVIPGKKWKEVVKGLMYMQPKGRVWGARGNAACPSRDETVDRWRHIGAKSTTIFREWGEETHSKAEGKSKSSTKK